MRRLACWVAVALFSTAAAWAQSAPAQKPAPPPLDLTGKWTLALEMSQGTATPALALKQAGEKITGSYTGRYGSYELQGTVKGRTLEFGFSMSAEGQEVRMTFKGEVAADAQTMKGLATLGELGEASWTAKRDK